MKEKERGLFFIPVHMHERLSASTDVSPFSPDAARDRSGAGRVRAGMSGVVLFTVSCGSAAEGVDCESLRFTPSTKARKESSGGDKRVPAGDGGLMLEAVG